MMPKVIFALFATHCRRHLGLALSKLDDIISQHGQRLDLIFDDQEPNESVTNFGSPDRLPTKVQRGLLQGTEVVLGRTHDE